MYNYFTLGKISDSLNCFLSKAVKPQNISEKKKMRHFETIFSLNCLGWKVIPQSWRKTIPSAKSKRYVFILATVILIHITEGDSGGWYRFYFQNTILKISRDVKYATRFFFLNKTNLFLLLNFRHLVWHVLLKCWPAASLIVSEYMGNFRAWFI